MRRRPRTWPALLTCAILAVTALGGAATAVAKPGVHVYERSLRLVMLTEASNDYSLWIETKGHRQVTLTMSKDSAGATYTTVGQVSRKGIEADFGELGKISVRFHGKLLRPRHRSRGLDLTGLPGGRFGTAHCHGRKAQLAFGDFRGTIRFEGENGYTSVDASKARGLVSRKYRRVCRTPQPPRPHWNPKPHKHSAEDGKGTDQGREALGGPKVNLLTAGGEVDGRQVFMQVLSIDSGPSWFAEIIGTLLIGGTLERRDGIRIERVTITRAGSNALTINRGEGKPTRVGVVFPRPLEGRAELVQAKGSPATWTGSLLMRPPGAGGVPLAGPGLSAVYCLVQLLGAEESPCVLRAAALVPSEALSGSPHLRKLLAVQESGSHSQALAEVRLSWSRYWRNSASSSGFTE